MGFFFKNATIDDPPTKSKTRPKRIVYLNLKISGEEYPRQTLTLEALGKEACHYLNTSN